MTYIDTTQRVGDLIVQVIADEDASYANPRDNDNLCRIYGNHRSYTIGDGKPPEDEDRALQRGGVALLYRWLRRYKGVVAFTKLGMLDHSGITFYPVALGSRGAHPQDYGGWDSGIVGYAYVDAKGLEAMGTDAADAERVMLSEIEEYDDWAKGNVWGYTVTKPCDHADEHDSDEDIVRCRHSEILDSCYGYIGDPKDCLTDALSAAQWHVEHPAVPA